MKRINDYRIGSRQNVLLSALFFIILGTITLVIIKKEKKHTKEAFDLRMFEQVDDLSRLIEADIRINQKHINNSLNIAHEWLYNQGGFSISENSISVQATEQKTTNTSTVRINSLQFNGQPLYGNYNLVDKYIEMTGITSTVFQRIPQGFLRISTNIHKLDGERATGTYIPNESIVTQTVMSGKTYTGRAYVVNDWYLTAYEPIIIDGDVVGIFYIGVPEKDLKEITNIFNNKKYLETGYPFTVTTDGFLDIHPTKSGSDESESVFFKGIIETGNTRGIVNYPWEGRQKSLYFNLVEEIDSYVCTSVYDDELLVVLNAIRNIFIASLVIGLIFFILINYLLSKTITIGLAKGVAFANKLAEGDLTAKLDIDQGDEVGMLAKALSNMGTRLRDIVDEVNMGANNIASASQQMSSTSQELSQGASEQASSAEEVSSSMEEMAANIQQNTDSAQQAEKIAITATDGIKEGSEAASNSVTSMKNIAEKIKIINDIAFQTNILALNAAVEAARAGEHGKGFAVVAAEVRKLAERSKVAADEIDDLSRDGVLVAEKAGNKLVEMVPEIEKTAKLVQEIAAASMEQNSGANQVNNAIQQLNQVTQQNAAASEEMATSSEELSSQADQLKEVMSFFNTGRSTSKKSAAPSKAKIAAQDTGVKKLGESKQTPKAAPKAAPKKAEPKTTGGAASDGVIINMGKDDLDDEYEKF